MNLDEHLATKTSDNGKFSETAEYAQGLKFLLRQGQNWSAISPLAKEALENIATRIAMILNGDHQRPDHWNKLAAYARLRGAGLEPVDVQKEGRDAVAMALDIEVADMHANKSIEMPVADWIAQGRKHKQMIPSTDDPVFDEMSVKSIASKLAPRT